MSDLKRTKPAYNVMFINTRIGCDGAGEGILISFPASNSFAYTAVQRPDVVESVSEALARAAGMPVSFRVEQDSAGAGQGAPAAPSAAQAPVVPQPPVMPAVAGASPAPHPSAAPAASVPSGGAAPAVSPALAAGPANAAPQPAAAQPAQPVMPRLRRSAAALDGSSRAAAGPDEEAPGSGDAGEGGRSDAAPEQGASEEVAADMPRPAPKRKKPLPVPGEGVKPPTYVREGIREERADDGAAAAEARIEEAPKAVAPSSAPAFTPAAPAPSPAPDDDYDRVPLDAYEGMAYPEDDVLPWEDAPAAQPTASAPVPNGASSPAPSPASVPAPAAPQPTVQPAPAPAVQTPAPSASAPTAAPAPVQAPGGPEPTADELNAFLSAGFGEGVVFQEVRE